MTTLNFKETIGRRPTMEATLFVVIYGESDDSDSSEVTRGTLHGDFETATLGGDEANVILRVLSVWTLLKTG